jgi:acyl-CoA synthetase (NDP forming)
MNKESKFLALQEIFNSENIAVIGASNNPAKLGYMLVENLIKQGKKIYPVNPNTDRILNQKVYPTVKEIPENILLAVIVVPPKFVLDIIEDCYVKGIKYIILISEGFKEFRLQDGTKLQENLKNKIKEYDIRLIGPNTMGIHDSFKPLTIDFVDMSKLKQGNVSISCQTGILAGALLQYLSMTKNIGINKVIDLGNMIDLSHADVLEYFINDKKTEVIAMHIEGITNGKKFSKYLKACAVKKPVIILKGGEMEETKRIVASHTGSLTTDKNIFTSMVKKAGAIQVYSFEEFVEVVKGFSYLKIPKGNQIAIITGSGGVGVVTSDLLLKNGLKLAKISNKTIDTLQKYIPEKSKTLNPIDIWPASMDYGLEYLYSKIISILDKDPSVNSIIAFLFNVESIKYNPKMIIDSAKSSSKPVFFCVQGHASENIRKIIEGNGFPTYSYGIKIVNVLKHMWNYRKFLESIK